MAKNVFGFGAMGVRPEMAAAPEDPREKRAKIEGIASRLQVPANVLLAMDEAGERDIEGAAGRISQASQAGKRLEEIVPESVLSRAYDIADQLYPRQAPVKPVAKGGLAAAFGSGIDTLQQGFGSAIEGAGRVAGLKPVERFGAGIAEENAREAEEGSAGLTQLSDVDGVGSAAKYAGEVVAQNAPQMGLSIAGGVAGAAAGSVIPVLGTAAGAVIGGIAGGMSVNLPLFYGQNRERQKEAIDRGIKTEVDEGTAFLSALPQAALDSVVDRFLVGKFLKPEVLNAGGILTRAVRSGAAGSVVEVPTEIGQQIIERAQAGLPLDDDEAISEYTAAGVAAGILGGSVGAASGALSGDARNTNPGEGDGSAVAGQNAEGIATPESVPSAFDETGAEQPTVPAGPISQIAASAPDMTPMPDAPQMFPDQKPGAPVRLRDPETGAILEGVFQREEGGNAIVRLGGEEVDIAPQLFDEMLGAARKADLAAEAAAKGGEGAAQDALIEPQASADPVVAQADGGPQADVAAPVPSQIEPTTQQPSPIAHGSLAEAAVKASPVAARPKDDPLKDLTPEQAAIRLKNVEERIRSAKTPRKSLIDLRDRLAAIVAGGVEMQDGGENVEVQSRVQPVVGDVGAPGGGDAGEVGRTDADRGQRDPQRAVQGGADPAPVLPGSGKGVADADPAPEPDKALTERARRPLKGTPPNPPTSVEPIKTAPADRIQPDMLGGDPVNEDQMAAKERTRREWGRVLGIAAGGSQEPSPDATAEGAPAATASEPAALPIMDARKEDKKRQAREAGDAIAQLRENGMRTGVPEEASPAPATKPAPKADPAPKPAAGILGVLSQEKQNRADELKAKLAAKARTQVSSGLDPEYITLGGELVALYMEAGIKKFGLMLRDFAESTGLTMREAQAPMRAAYNHVRDTMDLDGKDVSDMDDAAAVMAEVRKAMAEEEAAQSDVQSQKKSGKVDVETSPETSRDDNRTDDGDGGTGAKESAQNSGSRQGQIGSLRSDDRAAGRSGDRRAERAGERPVARSDGPGNGDGAGAGNRTGGRAGTGAANHVIEPGGLDLARGEKTRARESIAAIRTLRTLQSEGRPATAEERATLAKYGGAGTLAGTLPRSDGTIKFPELAAEIESMTTPEERATLSRTSQYAFYTAESALRSMWSLAEQLGFKGGRVYEPGMGVGGFAGTMPQSLDATYTGLELDHLTAQIAGALYPKHRIKNGDFIKEKLPQGFYDLVIGNPPFAGTKIQADPDYPQGFFIHDYFFAKSLDAVRPGGLLMFITSAGTMNKMDSKARDYLAYRADLVGAIRLPNTAFKENGTEVTTDIIVLRKRLEGEAEANPGWRTSEVIDLPRDDGTTGQAAVNGYFVANPDMILGEQGLYDTLTAGERVGVRPKPDSDLRKDLQAILTKFPTNIMSEPPASVALDALDAEHAETKPGSFYLKDGELYQFDGNTGRKVEARSRENTKGMPKAAMEAIKALIPIKNALRDVYSADVDGKDATAARKALNEAYDAYVKERGPIGLQNRREQRPSVVEQEGARQQAYNDARAAGYDFDIGSFDAGPMIEAGASMGEIARARQAAREAGDYREGDFDPALMPNKVIVTRPNIDPFMDDPESYRLLAIEKYDDKTDTAAKSRVFTENAVRLTSKPKINSPEDALLHLLGETGEVQPERIAALAGSTVERVIKELEGKIFLNPVTREWETKARYLSGNVVEKLEAAERESRTNPEYEANVDALRAVQPEPITSNEIAVPLGAHWFPTSVYSDFARSLGLDLTAEFKPRLGIWLVGGSTTGSTATSEWGTPDRPFADLMQLVMTNKPIEVKRSRKNSDGSTETWVDQEATQAATDKAKELQDRFKQWFWEDEDRTAKMEAIYNRTFNAEVAPQYDGSYLTTPGIHSDWSWRPHQTAVIARILQSGDTYMAHTVGAGKTSAMIGAGMEAKRLGLAKKPWYVVPNHMLIQFTTEFYQQYPLAKILVADDRRFHTSKRKQFVADAALGDYDAVIITHSAFHLIPPSEASKKMTVEGMLQDVRDVLEGLEGGAFGEDAGMERSVLGALNSMAATLGVDVKGITEGKTKTRKKIEALLEAAEQRISRQTSDEGKDAVFNFDETGADMLFVDEAHLFRKLSFATSLGNIKGIDPQGSQASMDLFIKTRGLAQRNPGRSLVLASGTPITNTMAELYSISRYLQPQALEDRNISAFDSWAATFGQTESALEQDPAGGYKTVTRFSKFVNTPELSLMVRQVMDVVSGPDLEKYVTRPALKGGKRTLVVVEPSPELKAYQKTLAERMKAIEKRKGPVKKGDDILLSVINDGRLAAIDLRLVDPDAGDTGSKLDQMVQAIYRRWKDGANAPLYGVKKEGGYTDRPVEHGPTTQIVFSTLGVNPTKHNPTFSVHRYIKAQLVSMGVPADEIILSENLNSDARKQRAFMDMNEGKKRILIGSKTLFTGVNAQRRITAIHNLDPLWFPADDEQRNGRGIRQGNMNREIEILDYSAKGTYDATMWQMMGRKAGFIEGFFRGDPSMRDMDDLGEASQYEQAKAMSTADPRVLQLTELRAERDKLARRAGAAIGQRKRMEATIRGINRSIDIEREELAFWEGQSAKVQDTQGDKFEARAGGKTYTERKEFGADLISAAEDALAGDGFKSGDRAAMISGFPVHIGVWQASGTAGYYIPLAGDRDVNIGWSDDPVGMARKVEGALSTIKGAPTRIAQTIRKKEAELADTKAGLAKLKDFAEQDKLNALQDQVDALESELLAEADGEEKQSRMGGIAATPANLRTVAASVAAELKDHGLGDAVKVRTVRGLLSATGMPVQGTYRAGEIGVNADAVNPLHTARHEIVHALRDANLWGRDYGLFTQEEWRALVRAARDDKGIRKAVEDAYPDLTSEAQTEEMVAELYAYWATDRSENPRGALGAALERIRSLFRAMASALRGEGFVDAARVMERMANGEIGGRGPDGPGGGRKAAPNDAEREMRAPLGSVRAKFAPLIGDRGWRDTPAMFSEWLSGKITDNMAGDKASFLGLIPGRALFSELGKGMLSARRYLRVKEEMDTVRDEWHADAAKIAQKWIEMQKKDPAANDALMDLMHRSTLTGVDPSRPDPWGQNDSLLKAARGEWSRLGQNAPAWARQKIADFEARQKAYAATKELFDALPPEFQGFYVEVKKAYESMADDFDRALEDNIKSAAKIALKRAEKAHRKEMRRIDDDGLTGAERAEAIEAADKELAKAKKRAQMGVNSKIKSLRKVFEGQRLKGPYFPLARFGNFWAVVRDADGKVINFSRFENSAQQRAFMREQEEMNPGRVRGGLLEDKAALRDQVDPKFVADIEAMLADTGASPDLMDAIWQRYLETLPDQSIRTSKIHRKGRAGFSRDALRSFTSHMFHGAHQLARLRYGLELGDALDDAADEAKIAKDPNRAMAIVNEMRRRMAWTMAPTNAPWVAAASSMAFVWYLGVSPAAALVNITQTTVIGPAVMKARFKGASVGAIISELGRASGDFVKGRGPKIGDAWSAENSPNLTKDEVSALKEAHRRGTIDRTQSHDLASVQESGIEFNPVRENIMRKIGWAFHHAERFNREVTFLANYRLARKDGQAHEDAIETAADLTWKIHFSYQNSDRPRAMQGDWPKLFLQFRQFTFNLLYRLFRDMHQSLNGATEADRKEARTQLVGISLSMMAHAGIKGVWGYSIIMGLLALFFPGDADDLEEWMQDALLMEGDSAGVAAWNYAMGAALNGVPGQITGVALTERIGSPNLWFRGPDRTLEGEDWLQSYVNELLGPSVGIAFSLARGAQNFADGDEVRGVEAITPKFIRDIIKTGRYAVDGVNTKNGDPLIESVNPWELFMQMNGFTPARVAERYEINSRLKNLEKEVLDERQALHRRAGDALRAGEPIPAKVMDKIRDFNARFPEYPITGDTLRQSIRSRERASQRSEFGISLNPKINDRLREGLAPSLYG